MPSVNRTNESTIDTFCQGTEEPKPPSAPPPPTQPTSVSPYAERFEQAPQQPMEFAAGSPCTPHELERALQDRENAIVALANAREPIASVAAASQSSGFNSALLQFELSTAKDPAFTRMLATFSKAEISEAVSRLIRDAAPGASEAEVARIQHRLVAHIDERVLVQAGQELKKAVTEHLKTAAARFEGAAADPKELEAIGATLNQLGEGGAQLRGSLGLSEDSATDPATIRAALQGQATLIRNEAKRVFEAGDTTLYRSLLLHSRAELSSSAADGSWAAQALQSVTARGHADEDAIKAAKLASALALAAASGGMGLGSLAGAGMVVGYNAPGLINSYQGIDRARAGVAAGTAQADAVAHAKMKFAFEAGETVVAAGAAGILGAHAAPSDQVLGHVVKDVVVDATIADTADWLHHVVTPHGTRPATADGISEARAQRSKEHPLTRRQ